MKGKKSLSILRYQLELRKQLTSALIAKQSDLDEKLGGYRKTMEETSKAYEQSKLLNTTLRASSLNLLFINHYNVPRDLQMSVYELEKQLKEDDAINTEKQSFAIGGNHFAKRTNSFAECKGCKKLFPAYQFPNGVIKYTKAFHLHCVKECKAYNKLG